MHRIALSFLLLLYSSLLGSQEEGVVWLEHPSCGGILVEPDVVLSLKTCVTPETQVVWPFKSKIIERIRHADANLAILTLERELRAPVKLINISELSLLKQGLPIRFSNLERSKSNWVDILGPSEFIVFDGLEQPLLGAPVLTDLPGKGLRVVGMLIDERKAMRLDPYYRFIHDGIQFARTSKVNSVFAVLPAIAEPGRERVVISAQVVEPPKMQPELPSNPNKVDKPSRGPESLGCSCSQVRRNQDRELQSGSKNGTI